VGVDGFQIDLRRGAELIEIQTRNFVALKRKLTHLVQHYPVRLVHPIAHEKWVVRLNPDGTAHKRRKSPKRGRVEHLFLELVSFPELVAHPNFTLEVLLTQEEEMVRPARAAWRRKGWEVCDRRLLSVVEQVVLASPVDYHRFLPARLPTPFTSQHLAAASGQPLYLAQKMAYCLRKMGAIKSVGRRGGAVLYALPQAKDVR
jgi:hypothetical protein